MVTRRVNLIDLVKTEGRDESRQHDDVFELLYKEIIWE